MEPQIEYATTVGGARLATLTLGSGVPLLVGATPPWSHVQQELGIPPVGAWWRALAEHALVIRYDCRGTGLSDRDGADLSVEQQVQDIDAVADHYGLTRFALFGSIGGSPAAIVYAARYAERLSHFLLWGGFVRSSRLFAKPGVSALGAMLAESWEMFSDFYAQAAFGWPDSQTAAAYAALMRASINYDAMLRWWNESPSIDVTEEARSIQTRTLVMARHESEFSGLEDARELTALIPTARLLVLEGSSPAPFLGDVASAVEAVRDFITSDEPAMPRLPKPPTAALTAREREVLRLLAGGSTGKEIAAALSISVATTQRHIANIYAKIGARGRVEAANYAFKHGMLPRDDA